MTFGYFWGQHYPRFCLERSELLGPIFNGFAWDLYSPKQRLSHDFTISLDMTLKEELGITDVLGGSLFPAQVPASNSSSSSSSSVKSLVESQLCACHEHRWPRKKAMQSRPLGPHLCSARKGRSEGTGKESRWESRIYRCLNTTKESQT